MDVLLHPPKPNDEIFDKPHKRVHSSYTNLSQRFKVPQERRYHVQYSQIYFVRISKMKARLVEAAKRRWGNDYPIKDLKDLKSRKKCIIIGTLFKKMDLQPSILKEISGNHHLLPQPSRMKCTSINDELILEDHIQRVILCGNVSVDSMTTGICVALLGRESDNGKFAVDEYCFTGIPEQSNPPPSLADDKFVLFVSGLNLGSSWCDQFSVHMLVDYVCGQLGGPKDQEFSSKICRVIIAGNSITDRPNKTDINKENKVRYTSRNYKADSLQSMSELDQLIAQLASCVSCDLMPGSHDPSNYQLPHQPLHKCMFQKSSYYSTLNGVTNPYNCEIDDISFLGTSGENINDLYRFTDNKSPLNLLQDTLEWSHIAPTTPDTLGCFPYSKDEPFIITECPHVYFVGNQLKFESKKLTGNNGQIVTLLCVPSFDLTQTIVLVNLKTLECTEVSFSTSLRLKPNPDLDDSCQHNRGGVTMMQELDSDDD